MATVFWSSNLRATHFAERIFDAVCDEVVENGTFGYLEKQHEEFDGHVYKFVKGFKAGEPVFVAHNPEWNYDNSRLTSQAKHNFVIEAKTPFRAFGLHKLDEFGISIEGITPATREMVENEKDFIGNNVYLTIDETTGKLVASAESNPDAVMEARIMRKYITGNKLVTPLRSYGRSSEIYEAKINVLA